MNIKTIHISHFGEQAYDLRNYALRDGFIRYNVAWLEEAQALTTDQLARIVDASAIEPEENLWDCAFGLPIGPQPEDWHAAYDEDAELEGDIYPAYARRAAYAMELAYRKQHHA